MCNSRDSFCRRDPVQHWVRSSCKLRTWEEVSPEGTGSHAPFPCSGSTHLLPVKMAELVRKVISWPFHTWSQKDLIHIANLISDWNLRIWSELWVACKKFAFPLGSPWASNCPKLPWWGAQFVSTSILSTLTGGWAEFRQVKRPREFCRKRVFASWGGHCHSQVALSSHLLCWQLQSLTIDLIL